MTAADRAAVEIGRLFMRAHAAEQQAEMVAQQLQETEARLAEFTNGVEKPEKPLRKGRAKK